MLLAYKDIAAKALSQIINNNPIIDNKRFKPLVLNLLIHSVQVKLKLLSILVTTVY